MGFLRRLTGGGPRDERKPDAWVHVWIDDKPPPLPPGFRS